VQNLDPKSKKQRATDYILLLDGPEDAVSENKTRTPDVVGAASENETRAVSEKQPEPCPKKRGSRVRNSDSMNLGIEPGIEPPPKPPKGGGRRSIPRFGMDEDLKRRLTQGASHGL